MSLLKIMQLLGGIGIFLFAIKMISDSLQGLAGDRMRQLIGMLTKTPVLGVLVGAGVTVLIQSSSATTVMTVSFVDAGLMTLNQAIGVIMGANIGTTVTGQILAFKIKDFAYLFIIVGVLFAFCCRGRAWKHLGGGLIGFGLLFVGMQTMETSMSFLRERQDIFLTFSANPLMGLAAGTMLTLLVQSSSATVGLTIALGMQGLLPLDAAIPIILGDNIGTTITAVLASFGTCRAARQACAAHVLFNVLGVCIFLPLMPLYLPFISSTADSIGHQIANAHTLFNICNTLLFLPFVSKFAQFIRRIIPDETSRTVKEAQYLDPKLVQYTPAVAVEAVRHECRHMGECAREMLSQVEAVFFLKKQDDKEEISALESRLDVLYEAIQDYAQSITRAGVSDADMRTLRRYVTCAGDLERIGDKGLRMLSFYEYRQKRDKDFSPEALEALHSMFNDARAALEISLSAFGQTPRKPDAARAEELAAHVRDSEASLRATHLTRLNNGQCSPAAGLVFIDVLGAIEHVAYRAKKITEQMAA